MRAGKAMAFGEIDMRGAGRQERVPRTTTYALL
jgi:hypothetical protein